MAGRDIRGSLKGRPEGVSVEDHENLSSMCAQWRAGGVRAKLMTVAADARGIFIRIGWITKEQSLNERVGASAFPGARIAVYVVEICAHSSICQ